MRITTRRTTRTADSCLYSACYYYSLLSAAVVGQGAARQDGTHIVVRVEGPGDVLFPHRGRRGSARPGLDVRGADARLCAAPRLPLLLRRPVGLLRRRRARRAAAGRLLRRLGHGGAAGHRQGTDGKLGPGCVKKKKKKKRKKGTATCCLRRRSRGAES